MASVLPRTSSQPFAGEDVAAKRYFSHNPRIAGQVLSDFAPTHVNAELACATRIVRLQLYTEGSCRILMEVLPPSSDLWSQTAGGSLPVEEARERRKRKNTPGDGGEGGNHSGVEPLSSI